MERAFSIVVEDAADGTLVVSVGAINLTQEVSEWHGQPVELRSISIEVLVAVVAPAREPGPSLQINGDRR